MDSGTAAVDDTSPEPSPADTIRTTRITIGTAVALAGSVAMALSSVLAWANQPYVPFDNPVYPEVFSVPALINPDSSGRIPSAAVVLLAFGGITGVLALIRPLGRWVDPLRRILGLIVLGICVLFVVRYSAVYRGGLGVELLGDLRAGFYLAGIGGLLVLVGGRVRD
ncbi:MAG: hypothetical protein ACRDJP_15915 [Actinomycetota bacterium]